MKLPLLFTNIAGLTLVALSLSAMPGAAAQTVISNETLVTTTFVVSKQIETAACKSGGCRAQASMLPPVMVVCPAASGKTCTFHISLDAKTSVSTRGGRTGSGSKGFYQFLADGLPPTIGPTDGNGYYLFERSVYTTGDVSDSSLQSYPASVVTVVANSTSDSHTIKEDFGCQDITNAGGCRATVHSITMRVDVFEP
jgi:hypothetical protein